MKKVEIQEFIEADVAKVYRTLLGLDDIATYEEWTKPFNPTSTFKGNWELDTKIYFTGQDENGEVGGMVSKVVKNVPNEVVAVQHIGILKGEEEILEGPEVDSWKGGIEEYRFSSFNGGTMVKVITDAVEGYESFFETTWPKSLRILKGICEKKGGILK